MVVLDPLHGEREDTCRRVGEYLKQEALTKLGVPPEDFLVPSFAHLDCPMQGNAYDCGVYCLYFMKMLYTALDSTVKIILVSLFFLFILSLLTTLFLF